MDHIGKRVGSYLQRTNENQRLEHQGIAFLILGGACILVMLTLMFR
jgi:hypothetical protein